MERDGVSVTSRSDHLGSAGRRSDTAIASAELRLTAWGGKHSGALRLRPSPKYAAHGVVRVVPPSETIARVLPLCEKIGVTRVADLTGLDRTGIPTFAAVRPREAGRGISYHNGKGLTGSDAKAGALMEALERHTAERRDLPFICGTLDDVRAYGPAVDPEKIVEPLIRDYDSSTKLEWVAGYDLMSNQPTFVPLNVVVCPYTPADSAEKVYRSHGNGLASGNTLEEAICHGICEVVERDALALAQTIALLAPAVTQLCLGGETEASPNRQPVPAEGGRRVALDTLPPVARGLVRKMERAGLRVRLRDISAPIGVATLECTCIEERLDGRRLIHGGSGSHPDARVAVTRALTEAAQSRVAHIQGGREDIADIVQENQPSQPIDVVDDGNSYSFTTIPTVENANIDDDIEYLLGRLSAADFDQVIFVDLTQEELGVPVVRALIPEAETWSLFFSHGARARLGDRAKQALSGAVGSWLG